MPIEFELSLDGNSLSISTKTPLNASQVETLISDLALLRAQMTPKVPSAMPTDENMRVSVQNEPAVEMKALKDGGVRLNLRNVGLGWLVFNLTPVQTAGLRDFLNVLGASSRTSFPSLFDDEEMDGNAPQGTAPIRMKH